MISFQIWNRNYNNDYKNNQKAKDDQYGTSSDVSHLSSTTMGSTHFFISSTLLYGGGGVSITWQRNKLHINPHVGVEKHLIVFGT